LARAVDPVIQARQNLTNVENLADLAVEKGVATRAEAARVLDLYRMKVDAAAAAVAELSTQAQLLSVPEGFERRFAAAIMKATNGGQTPISGERATEIREGEADVAQGELRNTTAQTERQTAAQRLLSGAISDTAKAQAQARVAFAEQLVQYPELGAATAKTALSTRDFGAFVKTLPPDLQKLWQAMDAGAAAQVAGSMNQASVQMGLQTEAAARLAAAAGKGEAAQRRANIENAVAASRLHGLEGATRAAQEAQEAFARTQIHGEFAGQIEQEVVAAERLAAAIRLGAGAARDAEIRNKAVAQTLREIPYPKAGESVEEWNRRLQANIALLGRQKAAADGVDLSRYVDQLKEARRGLEFQRATLGLSEDDKAIAAAREDGLEYLRRQGLEYEKLTGAQREQADEMLRAADANARLGVEVRHAESAYAAVGDAIDDGIVRPLESAVDAIVKGQGESVKWGNVLKGAFASVATDFLKMGTVNPLMNMAGIGSYRPSLWDLPMFSASGGGSPAAVQVQAMPGGGQSLTGMATNWGLGKAASWALDKTGVSSLWSGVMNAPLFGTGIDSVAPGIASGYVDVIGGAEIINAPISLSGVAPGYVDVIGASEIVNTSAMAGEGSVLASGGAPGLGSAGGGGVTLSGISTGVLAPAAIGGMGGAYLSNTFMGGSKIGGAVVGGALGAGAAYGAQLMGFGAGLGPWGIVAAAVIAAVMAAIGSQKPPQPYGGGWIHTDSTGKITRSDSG
ncbi:MAG TPA: hypothetical protein VGE72_00435, partial [Azospirillum sp.]